MSDDYLEELHQESYKGTHLHMQASMESIADMVQSSAKFRPGDKVCIKKSEFKDLSLSTQEEMSLIYTIKGATWKGFGIMYTVEYSGEELRTPIHEDLLHLAPIYQRRKLDL